MTPRVFMWVQTRLGLGHLARALTLGGAMAKNGVAVALAHGGPPVPTLLTPAGVTLIQLPAAYAPDLDSPVIRDAKGQEIDARWKNERIEALKGAVSAFRPDIFVTESFPLARWLFAFELIPVLEWLHEQPGRPLIVASVRDILTRPSKEKKIEAMIALARERYDLILCHSDESIASLPDSFPETARIANMTRYTGYVVDVEAVATGGRDGVIVSAGGGAAGEKLFGAALEAKRLWKRETGPWTLVAGPRLDPQALAALRAKAPDDVIIEGAVEGLSKRYAHAAIVVAQAGYNTVCESLAQGARLTVVPYSGGKETEQAMRARRFAELGLLTYVEETSLSGLALVNAMEGALDAPAPLCAIRFDGGAQTVRILCQAIMERGL